MIRHLQRRLFITYIIIYICHFSVRDYPVHDSLGRNHLAELSLQLPQQCPLQVHPGPAIPGTHRVEIYPHGRVDQLHVYKWLCAGKHIEAEAECPSLCTRHFQLQIFFHKCPINKKSALPQIMAWHRIGVKPLLQPILPKIYDASWSH